MRTAAHMADEGAAGSAQCSMCASQAATLWCHNDAAALCAQCDQSVHSRNPLAARHVRVPLCELCERLAATVYCRQVRVSPVDKRSPEAGRAEATARSHCPPRAPQDAASLCDGCSRDIHAANPLAGRHVLEAVRPVTAAPVPITLEGTRVAASANAAEIEEYRRQCEALLNGEETPEATGAAGLLPPPRAPSLAAPRPPGFHGPGVPAAGSALSGGGERQSASGAEAAPEAGLGGFSPFDDLFGADFGELDSDMPLEFAFLQAHGA